MTSILHKTSIFILSLFTFSCFSDHETQSKTSNKDSKATQIIEKALKTTNVGVLNNSRINFEFRDQKISYKNKDGNYIYTRTFPDTSGHQIIDTLTNNDFRRYKNDAKLSLSPKEKDNLSGGINSIIYFAFLPYRLQDPAVNYQYSGEVTIKDKDYHKIKVAFSEEGGGEDHDDIFFYYFDVDNYALHYLAYQYHTDGGGIRFRSAYNQRTVRGVFVQDYINYKADPSSTDFESIEKYYNSGELQELSRIELRNIEVLTE